jgi:hypothetical protein
MAPKAKATPAGLDPDLSAKLKEQGIELLHPISHGDEDGNVHYGRGVYQCIDAGQDDYIPLALAAQFLTYKQVTHMGDIPIACLPLPPEPASVKKGAAVRQEKK